VVIPVTTLLSLLCCFVIAKENSKTYQKGKLLDVQVHNRNKGIAVINGRTHPRIALRLSNSVRRPHLFRNP